MSRPHMLDPDAAAFEAIVERGIASLRTTARRGLAESLFGAVPIVDRWTMPAPDAPDAATMPILRVSPRRPDVADLPRVVCIDGGNRVWPAWRHLPGHGLMADHLTLDVKVVRPVRAAFLLAFVLPRDRPLLDAIAQGGRLGLTGAPRGEGSLMVLSLPNAEELKRLLVMLDGEG